MGIRFDESYYFDPVERRRTDREIADFLEERFPDYRLHNLESNLVQLDHYSPDLIYVGGIQPNLILGMLLGATFIPYDDQDADISETPLKGLDRISDLPPAESLLEHELIRRWSAEIGKLRGESEVIPPFFWDRSGRATIHGFITTALKFFGQEIFFFLADDPDFIKEFFAWYGEVSACLIRHFARAGGMEISSLHVGECSGTMLGAADFAAYLAPALDELSRAIADIRLHLCGNCDHLMEEIARVRGIVSLDTGSGSDPARIRRLLGADYLLDLMPPVELLLKGRAPGDVEAWLDAALEGNAGGPLALNYHLEPGYDERNHLLLHDLLYERGIVSPGRR
jgi:hypothetical protein